MTLMLLLCVESWGMGMEQQHDKLNLGLVVVLYG